MAPLDARPDFPVRAKLLGGPGDGKHMRLEESAIKGGYSMIDGIPYTGDYGDDYNPIFNTNKQLECVYRFWMSVDGHGRFFNDWKPNRTALFIPETLKPKTAWRGSLLLEDAKNAVEEVNERVSVLLGNLDHEQKRVEDRDKVIAASRERIADLEARLVRADRFAGVIQVAKDEIADVTKLPPRSELI